MIGLGLQLYQHRILVCRHLVYRRYARFQEVENRRKSYLDQDTLIKILSVSPKLNLVENPKLLSVPAANKPTSHQSSSSAKTARLPPQTINSQKKKPPSSSWAPTLRNPTKQPRLNPYTKRASPNPSPPPELTPKLHPSNSSPNPLYDLPSSPTPPKQPKKNTKRQKNIPSPQTTPRTKQKKNGTTPPSSPAKNNPKHPG